MPGFDDPIWLLGFDVVRLIIAYVDSFPTCATVQKNDTD